MTAHAPEKPAAAPIAVEEAFAMIATSFNEPVENIRADTARDALAGWDSMGVLMLTAEFDERFSCELTSEESGRMRSVADILEFLRARGLLQA